MLTPPSRNPAAQNQTGFVILDALIAILLFSVGVLGLIALQSAMTKSQLESKVRADASYLANELVAQIWSDTANINAYLSDCESHGPCKTWQSKVTAALPSGEGAVSPDASGGIIITITWTNTAGDQHRYVTQTSVSAAGG